MTNIDEKTGLSTEAWDVGMDRKGRVRAVWNSENEYVITSIGNGLWSLDEAGETLGSFASAIEAAAAMPILDYNPWEDVDGLNRNLYLSLAPKTFEEWVSGETGTISLSRENGCWWLSIPNQVGQSDYPTRLQGMIAGLQEYEASYEESEKNIIRSLGLDAEDWRVVLENDNIVAVYLQDEKVTLQADSNSLEWMQFNGDDIVGSYPNVKDAAAAVSSRSLTM